MNLRHLAILLCVIVVGTLAVFIFMPDGTRRMDTPQVAQVEKAASQSQTDILKNDSTETKVDLQKLGAISANEGKAAIDYGKFLTARGETAANLIAVFEHSNDEQWLKRALELHPGSPIVLMSAIHDFKSATSEQRRAWIDRFKEVDAGNPIPWILSANEFLGAGKKSEAFAEASTALERPAFYLYMQEKIASERALLVWGGKNPIEAELLATYSMRLHMPKSVMSISKALEATRSEEWPIVQAAEASRIQFGLGKIFQTPEASRSVIHQLMGMSLERKGIDVLPQTERPKRLAEMDAFKSSLSTNLQSVEPLMLLKNEVLLAAYLRKLRTEGELSAMRWLQSQQVEK